MTEIVVLDGYILDTYTVSSGWGRTCNYCGKVPGRRKAVLILKIFTEQGETIELDSPAVEEVVKHTQKKLLHNRVVCHQIECNTLYERERELSVKKPD